MNKTIQIIFFLSLCLTKIYSQKTFEFQGAVNDTMNKPIVNAHLKVVGQNIGTISNEDGDFSLKSNKCKINVEISHLLYESKKIEFDCKNILSKNIVLNENPTLLNEVTVTALTAEEITKRTILNLEDNHAIDKVTYNIFSRIVEHQDYNPITLKESIFNMGHDKTNKAQFKIIKLRGKAYLNSGEKALNKTRLIDIHSNDSHILLRYKPNFLKKIKKKYSYSYKGMVKMGNKEYYIIELKSSGYIKNVIIHIDVESYGVGYIKKEYKDERIGKITLKKSSTETYFEQISGQWYFSHGVSRYNSCNNKTRICITNETITTVLSKKNELTILKDEEMGNMAQKSMKFTSDFDDAFWENYNYIPLPEWLNY